MYNNQSSLQNTFIIILLSPPYLTSDLLTFRPTAISDLRQQFIFVLFES